MLDLKEQWWGFWWWLSIRLLGCNHPRSLALEQRWCDAYWAQWNAKAESRGMKKVVR